ncbi:pro-sigmaK processing inhibitor BofA [Desulfofarcimen acetoxidans DSM 771]|uniref:Pro-sigmaK processing inhibitor BofA n=1 Tax=Desulfofarcimen acetoxidans (strain ATCC 49208 / DSM 771 / KCTC 5769 / VKM B-1644 / 5575) TaxID=485916 RepID=C8W2Q2_DESAS|nr:pro-sigmaK processing inhibitor BofA family protein [Desulfofarcimen acetoxidans]ACV61058.1 pro-sigmaK processing inhibitor BofA [Desulfofarcimen acetoxidans DSM 771]
MEKEFIYWGLLGFTGIYLVSTVFYKPVKYLMRICFYFIIGGFLLVLVNFALKHLGLQLAINPLTMLTAGLLQLPGVILLLILNYLIM